MKVWTPEEVEYLKLNYSKMSNRQISEVLGCAAKAVQWKAYLCGLKKDPTHRPHKGMKYKPCQGSVKSNFETIKFA